jgi:hypothetical protein
VMPLALRVTAITIFSRLIGSRLPLRLRTFMWTVGDPGAASDYGDTEDLFLMV